MSHSLTELEKYGPEFSDYWQEYCVNNCPTEGYDDAIESAYRAWQYQEARIEKQKTLTFNINKDEVLKLLTYIAESKFDTVTLHHTPSGIGGITEVQRTAGRGTRTDITNYGCW